MKKIIPENGHNYYLAYGSNLHLEQMSVRCPDAIPVGTSAIHDYHLLFKGSQSGSYLTVEPCEGCKVPVVVWDISETDERSLDRYEGYPTFYYKDTFPVNMADFVTGKSSYSTDAIIYIMHEERHVGIPSYHYYAVCAEGYHRFGFDETYLRQAVIDSIGKAAAKKWFGGYQTWLLHGMKW